MSAHLVACRRRQNQQVERSRRRSGGSPLFAHVTPIVWRWESVSLMRLRVESHRRYTGLFGNRHRAGTLARCRQLLAERLTGVSVRRCPMCQATPPPLPEPESTHRFC